MVIKGYYVAPTVGRGTYCFGADPVGVGSGIGHTFLSAQYRVNQWLDSYQKFMDYIMGT